MKKTNSPWKVRQSIPLYYMLLPGAVAIFTFNILPLFGLVIAFEKYNPFLGFVRSPFIGLDNFVKVFSDPLVWKTAQNTIVISLAKMFFGELCGLLLAIMLNEVIHVWFRRFVQSITYMLYFLSWVVFGGIIIEILSFDGMVNGLLENIFKLSPVNFLTDPGTFPTVLIATSVWKNSGFAAVIYLAALMNIDPALLEAASVDGANRSDRFWHIVLPGIAPTVILMMTLNLGWVLDAGFDQVVILYNPLVYSTSDIIDTYIYRVGFTSASYSIGAAVGLVKSIVGGILIALSFYLAKRLADYRIL